MFCSKCGTQNTAGGGFCSSCGNQLDNNQAASPSQNTVNQANANSNTSPPPSPYNNPIPHPPGYYPGSGQSGSKGKMVIPVIAGLLLIGAIVCCCVFVF